MTARRMPVALVTGGGSGVGLEIARALGTVGGHAVAVVGRSPARLDTAMETLRDGGAGSVAAFSGDVRDDEFVRSIVGLVESELGPIDVAVHAAGTCIALGSTWEVDPIEWRADVDTSLVGAYSLVHRIVPGMIDRGRGRLIALNSYAAVRPAPYQSAYAAGKAALASLIQSLHAELDGTGVRVFSVTPGFVRTELTAAMARTPWFASLAERNDAVPAQRVAALVVRISRGDADPLSGRFLHALDDLDELLARVSEIERDELYAPRLRRLQQPTGA